MSDERVELALKVLIVLLILTIIAIPFISADAVKREQAYHDKCLALDGIMVPTNVSQQRGIKTYGNYVCMKKDLIKID